MAEFPKEFSYELEIWTPDMAKTPELEDTLIALQERGIVAARGLTPELAWSLGVVCNQSHIVEFCENEPSRFATENRAKAWQAKGRDMFSFYEVDGFKDLPLSKDDLASVQEADLRLLMYGFSGPKKNEHIPGADITTAYRATELGLGRRLSTPLLKFVVGATIQLHDLEPEDISLDAWRSNDTAVSGYKKNNFIEITRQWDERATLQAVGTLINGHTVRAEPTADNPDRRIVNDRRVFMRYDPAHRVAAA